MWVGEFHYPITLDLEKKYYSIPRLKVDKYKGIVTIEDKDLDCLIHDADNLIGDINTLPRNTLLNMEYEFNLYYNKQLVVNIFFKQDPAIKTKVNLYYKEYEMENPPVRLQSTLLRVLFKIPKADMEYYNDA